MMNEYMKRANDLAPPGSDGHIGNDGPKRPRSGAATAAEHSIATVHLDPPFVNSRLLVTKAEFGRVIGKGGQMIASIRGACGAVVKGIDVDSERRILVLTGSFRQVVDAFEMISEMIYAEYVQRASLELFRMQLLVENTKAGRIVGPRGQTISMLKNKSGVAHLNMSKDPEELLSGHQLRVITVEGTIVAMRRIHLMQLELMYPQVASRALRVDAAPFTLQGGHQVAAVPATASSSSSSAAAVASTIGAVAIENLVTRGVHGDVVRQIADIQAYVGQLGLQLYVVDKAASAAVPVASLTAGMAAHRIGGFGTVDADRKKYLEFAVPREAAGAIIGKGGSVLRDLQQETGAHIHVDRDDPTSSMRRVVVKADDEASLARAHDHVLSIVTAQLAGQHEGGAGRSSGAFAAPSEREELDTEPLDPFGL